MNTPNQFPPMTGPEIHCVLDLETLGTAPGSVILSIGAVLVQDGLVTDRFYRVIRPSSCEKMGMKCDAATALWWLTQNNRARVEVAEADTWGIPLPHALREFSEFVQGSDTLWGNGSDFDNIHLERAYQLCGLPRPWKYTANRCLRTLRALHPGISHAPPPLIKHHALHDAEYEARILIDILEHLAPSAIDHLPAA